MSQTDLFTDDAIAERTGDVPPEPQAVSESAVGEVAQPDQPAETVAGGEPETAAEQAERLLANKYKTPEDLEKGYEQLWQMHSRKEQEWQEQMNAANAMFEQLLYNQQPQQPQSFFAAEPESIDELRELAMSDPNRAFAFASQHDLADELVPHVVATVRGFNEVAADSMYTQHLKNMVQREVNGVREELAPMQVSASLQQVLPAFQAKYPDFADIEQDMVQIAAGRQHMLGDTPTAGDFYALLEDAYWIAQGRKARTVAAQQFAQQPTPPAPVQPQQPPFVESGTPGAAPTPDDLTIEDEIKASIMKVNRSRDPWAAFQ